jgi:hypothetical protein
MRCGGSRNVARIDLPHALRSLNRSLAKLRDTATTHRLEPAVRARVGDAQAPAGVPQGACLALAGGRDGLDLVRRIVLKRARSPQTTRVLVVEVGHNRAASNALSPRVPLTGRRRAAATTAFSDYAGALLAASPARAPRATRGASSLRPRQRAHLAALQRGGSATTPKRTRISRLTVSPALRTSAAPRGCGPSRSTMRYQWFVPSPAFVCHRLALREAVGELDAARAAAARCVAFSWPTMRTAYSRSTAKRGCIMRLQARLKS